MVTSTSIRRARPNTRKQNENNSTERLFSGEMGRCSSPTRTAVHLTRQVKRLAHARRERAQDLFRGGGFVPSQKMREEGGGREKVDEINRNTKTLSAVHVRRCQREGGRGAQLRHTRGRMLEGAGEGLQIRSIRTPLSPSLPLPRTHTGKRNNCLGKEKEGVDYEIYGKDEGEKAVRMSPVVLHATHKQRQRLPCTHTIAPQMITSCHWRICDGACGQL